MLFWDRSTETKNMCKKMNEASAKADKMEGKFKRSLKMNYHKTINTIAASAFGVLCIHANSDTMRLWLWRDICNNVGNYKMGNVAVHAVACVATIYAVCTVIDMIRICLIEKNLRARTDCSRTSC